jgi:hypothetical protein
MKLKSKVQIKLTYLLKILETDISERKWLV